MGAKADQIAAINAARIVALNALESGTAVEAVQAVEDDYTGQVQAVVDSCPHTNQTEVVREPTTDQMCDECGYLVSTAIN